MKQHMMVSNVSAIVCEETEIERDCPHKQDKQDKQISNKRKVHFKLVQIRFYEQVIGDNPSCSSGAPISLGWNYVPEFTLPLDHFEIARGPMRRHELDLILTRRQRKSLLMEELGYSYTDIVESIRAAVKVKRQRRSTVSQLGKMDRFDQALESINQTMKQTLQFGFGQKPNRKPRLLRTPETSDDDTTTLEDLTGGSCREFTGDLSKADLLADRFNVSAPF
jgi:hypothetical protein